jgi:hypothetical protein
MTRVDGARQAAEWPRWEARADGSGLLLADAPPRIWLDWRMLDDLIDCMPLFPTALVSTDFTACPEGHYEPGDGAVGAVLRFKLTDGRQLVYRIEQFSVPRLAYECAWPD